MPKNSTEMLTPTRLKLSVEVTLSELQPFVQRAYREFSKNVNIPGFRKGKVPAAVIRQRLGLEAVQQEAVNQSLDFFYQQGLQEAKRSPLSRPTVDVERWLDMQDEESTLLLGYEVEVRPKIALPAVKGRKITVSAAKVNDEDVDAELEQLRQRFGTLTAVEKAVATGDFVELDLVAKIDGAVVDQAKDISYEVGSGNMLEGMDEALETLTAGESAIFNSQLLGGEYEGQDAEVEVTVQAVKRRELPDADDDFAQLASEFDTVAELRADLAEQAGKGRRFGQAGEAREKLLEELVEEADVPLSEELIEERVNSHLEEQGKLEDDDTRSKVRADAEKQFQTEMLLDELVLSLEVRPSQNELTSYVVQYASRYGMEPGQFLQVLSQNGQLPAIAGEVSRNKAVAMVLSECEIVDEDGETVDLSEFFKFDSNEQDAAADTEDAKDADDTVAKVDAADAVKPVAE